jgi:hypothetical protein
MAAICQAGGNCISRSILDSIEIPKRDKTTSGLAATILCFRSWLMLEGVRDESDDLVDLEYLCIGF